MAKPGRTWWGSEPFQVYAKLSNVLWLGSSVFNTLKTPPPLSFFAVVRCSFFNGTAPAAGQQMAQERE